MCGTSLTEENKLTNEMKLKYFFLFWTKNSNFKSPKIGKINSQLLFKSTCTFISPEEKDHKNKIYNKTLNTTN